MRNRRLYGNGLYNVSVLRRDGLRLYREEWTKEKTGSKPEADEEEGMQTTRTEDHPIEGKHKHVEAAPEKEIGRQLTPPQNRRQTLLNRF